jgi:hypothetical protein
VVVGVRRGLGVRGALHPPPTHVIPVTAGAAFASCCPSPGALLTGKALRACARVSCATRCSCAGNSPRAGVGFTAACAQTHRLPL